MQQLSTKDLKQLNAHLKSGFSKYGSVKVECDGFIFDSQLERDVYLVLKDLHDRAIIKNLYLQHQYDLHAVNGKRVAKYFADFVCELHNGSKVVVEAKGKAIGSWGLKKKLFLAEYGSTEALILIVVKRETIGDFFFRIQRLANVN